MQRVRVYVPGQPIAWARARINPRGAHFTPKHVRTWQGVARTAAATAMDGRALIDGPLRLAVTFYLAIPGSWPAWKRMAAVDGALAPAGRPDLDNLVKNVEDALNNVAWRDDAQLAEIVAAKAYADTPRTEILIEPVDAVAAAGARKRDVQKRATTVT